MIKNAKEWWATVKNEEKPGLIALAGIAACVFIFASGIWVGRSLAFVF
ncbi:hypothetical protein [Microbulbifer celer]|uniref:Uncharacterized protein n=1 Tax=Microbulbifer celer TaxID=435905 RepID=A0ABW3UCF0_9GAMM|nr:hypothetical protein [Microbulbifer celer]UFN55865.1 hypothetical protein LPW13_09755 [Microbulbifer celer]